MDDISGGISCVVSFAGTTVDVFPFHFAPWPRPSRPTSLLCRGGDRPSSTTE